MIPLRAVICYVLHTRRGHATPLRNSHRSVLRKLRAQTYTFARNDNYNHVNGICFFSAGQMLGPLTLVFTFTIWFSFFFFCCFFYSTSFQLYYRTSLLVRQFKRMFICVGALYYTSDQHCCWQISHTIICCSNVCSTKYEY